MASISRRRPLWRTLVDATVFAAVLAGVALSLEYFGFTTLTPGRFKAIDGDSLRRGTLDVRLYGIDAPELNQKCNDGQGTSYPCGREALRALSELVTGQDISCRSRDVDRYGRTVAVCDAGGLEINLEMVRRGWAVAYQRHGFAYVLAERDARKSQRGMWYGDFEMPDEYRARHRVNKGDVAGLENDSTLDN
jgi:endonuclease YncB( thermonuclease family)